MTKYIRLVGLCLSVATLPALLTSCQSDCIYPEERSARVRLVNAMPDVPRISVFINNKLFKENFPYEPPQDFGYYTNYTDGTGLMIGDSIHVVATTDAAGQDTIISKKLRITVQRQTMVVIGLNTRLSPLGNDTRDILLLNDEEMPDDNEKTLLRFVHAVPDLPALDVYMKSSVQGQPFVTLQYGKVVSYESLPINDGLTVTEAGNPNNVILRLPYPFNIKGFLATAIIRGSSRPIGTEPLVAPFLLSDKGDIGNYILNFGTFGVRFINGMRNQTLSLLTQNMPPYTESNKPDPRSNVPGQEVVLDVASGTVSEYFGVGVAALGSTNWFFSRNSGFPPDTIRSFALSTTKDKRWSMIAVDKALSGGGLNIDHLVLQDTMTRPADPTMTRVRIVNVSPDHGQINFTFAGRTVSMKQMDVEFFTASAGQNQITFSDGSSQRVHTLTITDNSRPLSIYILPDKEGGESYPVVVSDK